MAVNSDNSVFIQLSAPTPSMPAGVCICDLELKARIKSLGTTVGIEFKLTTLSVLVDDIYEIFLSEMI